jgi:hypothetical protein
MGLRFEDPGIAGPLSVTEPQLQSYESETNGTMKLMTVERIVPVLRAIQHRAIENARTTRRFTDGPLSSGSDS